MGEWGMGCRCIYSSSSALLLQLTFLLLILFESFKLKYTQWRKVNQVLPV